MVPKFFEIRIENTNACGYRCVMCPREKQTRKIGFMPLADFKLILNKLETNQGDLHLHGYGEPLLDENLSEKIALVKEHSLFKTFIISTLGVEMSDDTLEGILKSGLDTLMVSFYGFTEESYESVHRVNKLELAKKNLRTLGRLKKEKGYPTRIIVKIAAPTAFGPFKMISSVQRENEAMYALIQEIKTLGLELGALHHLHNYGDGRLYNMPDQKLCPVIHGRRSQILNVTWDLNVIPCCFDFNSSIIFGNLRTQTLEEIFAGPAYQSFRAAHLNQTLENYPVCQNCEKQDYI